MAFARVVYHEFGHALGLAHEHQHPHDNCTDEIDWPRAYAFYAAAPNNWTSEQVDANLKTLKDSAGLRLSDKGDGQSIMRFF